MSSAAEILQSLAALGGVATTISAVVMVTVRADRARDLKKLDLSIEWQNQMLTRIAVVEAALLREQIANGELERESFKWQKQAGDLEWELRLARTQRDEAANSIAQVRGENEQLRGQNAALAKELREFYRDVQSTRREIIPKRSPPRG